MKLFLVLGLISALAGCIPLNTRSTGTAPPVPGAGINMGDAIEPPAGFIELCARDPAAPECGGGQ